MEDPAAKEQHPNLYVYLEKRLPELGLDLETYMPYVLGATDDEDELSEIVQLLQASSESHGEDDDIWTALQTEVLNQIKLDKDYHKAKQEKEVESQKAKLEDQLAQAKLEQQNAPAPDTSKKTASKVDDETKRALMMRFGYEEDGENGGGDDNEGEVQNNRQAAAAANLERARDMRSKKVQTKKDEQKKTKDQKASKVQLKEERRKRATKGERRR